MFTFDILNEGAILYFARSALSLIMELGRLWLYRPRLALSPVDDRFGFVVHCSLRLALSLDAAFYGFGFVINWCDLLYL